MGDIAQKTALGLFSITIITDQHKGTEGSSAGLLIMVNWEGMEQLIATKAGCKCV